MFLLYLLELAERAYLKVHGNHPEELFSVKKFTWSTDFRLSMVEVLQIYVYIMRKSINLLNFYLLFSSISSSPNATSNWFCLLFLKFQSFAALNAGFTGKNIGWYRLLHFTATLSCLTYYSVEVKFHKNERYPDKFFNQIISQRQVLAELFY